MKKKRFRHWHGEKQDATRSRPTSRITLQTADRTDEEVDSRNFKAVTVKQWRKAAQKTKTKRQKCRQSAR